MVLDGEALRRAREGSSDVCGGPSRLLWRVSTALGVEDALGGAMIGFGARVPGLGPSLLLQPRARSSASWGLSLRTRESGV